MYIKNRVFIFVILFCLPSQIFLQKTHSLRTIIIDPGHGRPDVGAKGVFSYEADVTLAFGLKLQKKIKQIFPEINIIMTRTDENLPQQLNNSADANRLRANIANENKGDLFISIHADSEAQKYKKKLIGTKDKMVTVKDKKGKKSKKIIKQNIYQKIPLPHKASGSSIYIIAAHKSKDKNEIIKENMDMLMDEADTTQELNSPELMAMAAIWQKKFFKKSYLFASLIHEEFKRKQRISHGVKQRNKGIWVLQATSMPSVLIETGYICTGAEELYLNSEEGQNEIIDAVITALKNYKQLIEANVYTIPKELIAPELNIPQDVDEDVAPNEREVKLYSTIYAKSNKIKIHIYNNTENDSCLYSVLDNTTFIDKKIIPYDKPETFMLSLDSPSETDLTIMGHQFIEPISVGSLNVVIEDGNKKYQIPVFINSSQNASILIKKNKK